MSGTRHISLTTTALLLLFACRPPGVQDSKPGETGAPPTDDSADTASADTASADTGNGQQDTGDTGAPFSPPEWCEAARAGLQEVTTTPAAPYFVHHPVPANLQIPTVIFLPGSSGSRGSAQAAWEGWFSRGDGLDALRAVVIYAADNDLLDEWDRVPALVDEVLTCYGGDPQRVHLGGTSNGGLGAFEIMKDYPDLFATLHGSPGTFMLWEESRVAAALTGKSVFNAVGENDTSWQPYVAQTQERLEGLGIDSLYVELEGQGHVLTSEFDESLFFDFWLAH